MSTSRARMPLATKILVGLALNLALLSAGFAVVFVLQVRLNPDWLLAGRAGERLQAAAQILVGDLAFTSPNDVDTVLDRYREAYQMDFRLFDLTGRSLAGPAETPPAEVLQLLGRQRGPFPGRGPRGGLGNPGARSNAELPRSPRGRPQFTSQEGFPRFVRRAGVPPAYWVIIHLPAVGEFRPISLVVRSESLWTGALLLDAKPWLLAAAGAFALSGLFWLPLMRGITRDIGRMMRGTEAIASGRFESRLDLRRSDELGRLAEAIDQMAGRLAGFVAGQKRFLGDAAHELCSPLARMQAAVAVLGERDTGDAKAYIDDIREELEEMAALVNELLAFSRATHGRAIELESIPLLPLVERAWAREGTDAIHHPFEISKSLRVEADAGLLQRAVANLIRNAVRYAADQGPISISATDPGDAVTLTVTDEGPGVPAEALLRLFEPFYRPEPSRSRELGGVGLGLAIVKTCIDACGGTVTANNRTPRGFEVVLTLRRARATPSVNL